MAQVVSKPAVGRELRKPGFRPQLEQLEETLIANQNWLADAGRAPQDFAGEILIQRP
jgi:hypothetical protein